MTDKHLSKDSFTHTPSEKENKEGSFEATLKSNDTEERIDIWFYRPIGYRIAKLCSRWNITPNAVTITSIFLGIAAGILFYYQNIWINVVGMLLLVFANSLDSADGQLARLTKTKSRFGRILDGIAGDFWFASINIAIALRIMNEGWGAWVWIFAILSGVSHVVQSAMADYYRNVYLFFLKGNEGSELDNSKDLAKQLPNIHGIQKPFFNAYYNYTVIQERLSPNLQKLLGSIKLNKSLMNTHVRSEFLQLNKPLMRYTNIIQFNTRVIFLFIWLFLNQTFLYFLFDIIILNPILIYLIRTQEKYCSQINNKIEKIAQQN